jgi:serine protease inhibitor
VSNSNHDSQIENIASQIVSDKISLDEQNLKTLQKYYDYAKTNFKLKEDDAILLINEAFLYLKLKSTDFDPLQEGDKFGAGFS